MWWREYSEWVERNLFLANLFWHQLSISKSIVFIDGDKIAEIHNPLHDLQVVCDRLATSAEKWQLRIAFDKCSVHRICNRDNVNVTVCSPKYKIGAHVLRSYAGQMRLVTLELSLIKKLNFNSHVSAVAHKAHVRASLILRTFQTRDPVILTKACITYVRPILEYCTSVWSPHAISNINKIESCQRWFTKRIKGMLVCNILSDLHILIWSLYRSVGLSVIYYCVIK